MPERVGVDLTTGEPVDAQRPLPTCEFDSQPAHAESAIADRAVVDANLDTIFERFQREMRNMDVS